MHILPLLILALLLSCTASKKQRKQSEQPLPFTTPTYLPPQKSSPNSFLPVVKGKPSKGHDETGTATEQNKGKDPNQHEAAGKEPIQNEETGKLEEGKYSEKQVEPEEIEEAKKLTDIDPVTPVEEVLSVKLSFATIDGGLYPLLEFSEQYLVEISDIELRHAGEVTLKLEDNTSKFESQGIKLPTLVFWLKLKWRDKTCHERIEVEDMTQTMEVLCQ